MEFKRTEIEEIDIKRVINVFLELRLKQLVKQVKKSGKRFSYFIFDFDKDIMTEYRLLEHIKNLRKRAIKYGNRSKEETAAMLHLDTQNNIVIFAIIIMNNKCRSIVISLDLDDLDTKPFSLPVFPPYKPSSLFTDNLLIQNFQNTHKDTAEILQNIKKKSNGNILVVKQHYNSNIVRFIFETSDEIEHTLTAHFVHPTLIKTILRNLNNKRVVLYYVIHYLAIYPLVFGYSKDKKNKQFIFTSITD